ncbi:pyridine nucleotide-disulfide oxidoreductase domain-containing protein 1-like [Pollicipes pollicipes]|uniref:pyridine nucleotide-disulfide oxidoreductase domain-containing protein 1-like n=1 Tax=Pollicipes pollicipes TaxID=41117 RepID=UPI0018852A0A|nr:pyridine nucleotide-disulfide oxidoreductase domain-containing protein 1-like [Pollicipes pollicipes]
MAEEKCTYLIIGGGIAGVSCAEQLSFDEPSADVLLVSAADTVRQASAVQVTRLAHELRVREVSGRRLAELYPNVRLRQGLAAGLDAQRKELRLADGAVVRYDRVCVCTGARPRFPLPEHPAVIGIRDGHSVEELRRRLSSARRVLIVGNGGIASELVFALQDVEVIWVIRDGSISSTFVDPGAAEFLLPQLEKQGAEEPTKAPGPRRWRYNAAELGVDGAPLAGVPGCALGPDWLQRLEGFTAGTAAEGAEHYATPRALRPLPVGLCAPPRSNVPLPADSWPVYVELSSGEIVGCDFVVSATGVRPNTEPFTADAALRLADDGGLLVDEHMRTSEPTVYAAGDVCTPGWELAPHWLQMRLWSQARQMGLYAAKCMSADRLGQPLLMDFCFEMFAHVTRLLGHKLILLGLYNGQRLGTDYTALIRMTPGVEFVKVVLRGGRVQGALLLGDTELEETFENLILSQMDVSHLGDDLLAPDVDIDDYFD